MVHDYGDLRVSVHYMIYKVVTISYFILGASVQRGKERCLKCVPYDLAVNGA